VVAGKTLLMAGSAHIVTRKMQSGTRYIVRYRRGGRAYPLEHGGSFRRLDQAKSRERLISGWLASGLDPRAELEKLRTVPDHQTVAKIAEEWLASRIDLAAQSRRVYGAYVAAIGSSPLGQTRSPTPADVRTQIEAWLETGSAPKTIRERVSVLRQALDFAEVEPNPARHRSIRLPAPIDVDLVVPAAETVLQLLYEVPHKYRLPLVLLEQTAMRIGEVVSLERDDVDTPALRFRIKATNRKGRRGSRRARFVPAPDWLMEVVATSLPLNGPLFPDVTADGLRSAMTDGCTRAGLTHCTPHRLRHRRISLWHFQGVPARELADRAGHSKPSMSLDIYSHVIAVDEIDPETFRAVIEDIGSTRTTLPGDAPVMHEATPVD
jgi:integrase